MVVEACVRNVSDTGHLSDSNGHRHPNKGSKIDCYAERDGQGPPQAHVDASDYSDMSPAGTRACPVHARQTKESSVDAGRDDRGALDPDYFEPILSDDDDYEDDPILTSDATSQQPSSSSSSGGDDSDVWNDGPSPIPKSRYFFPCQSIFNL